LDNSSDISKHGQAIDRAFLFSHLRNSGTVLLESSRQDDSEHRNLLFHSPVEILTTDTPDGIADLFHAMEQHRRRGHWLAGFVSYEAGYYFTEQELLPKRDPSAPLLWFGVYNTPISVPSSLMNEFPINDESTDIAPRLSILRTDYEKQVLKLKEYILNGDTYQVNYTDRFEFSFSGDARELYFDLRRKQHVPFGAFINTGVSQILSYSPELFFRRKGNSIITKPMKGTCRRGKTTAEDAALSEWLRNDEKNRSENLMIVDLLRNDIGRICESGSVNVKDMYSVERYETVLQMTSTVEGTLKENVTAEELFRSLFPCGSVTGAPKIRTMQIIHESEQHPRGVYCGAIGFISPENESVFNVAIRTLQLTGNNGIMGVGSGIVHDSIPAQEFEECRLKAAFLLQPKREFQLLETLRWRNGFSFLEEHLRRVTDSADYWDIPFDPERTAELLRLTERAFDGHKEYRIRLLISQDGRPMIEAAELLNAPIDFTVRIAAERVDSSDRFLYHKTTNRELYDRYQKKASHEAIVDYLFLNERNEMTEGSIHNIFIEKNGVLMTPPVASGILAGIYRNDVLRTNPSAVEHILTADDLRTADAIFLCNSVRGWRKVTLSE
jgi:para-aminobenzoate synthetase/4-amino-4-deoxychorismate lyase